MTLDILNWVNNVDMNHKRKQLLENAIQYWTQQLILEDKQAFLRKFANEPDVIELTNHFWNNVRSRAKGQYKDIEYWYKRPYSEFREFVNGFDMTSNKEQRAKDDANVRYAAENEGATLIGNIDGFEVWHIADYEAARLIGRDYKHRWAKWCISSDDPEYWYENYDRCEFLFLVRENPINDEYDKVAIQFEDGGRTYNVDNIVVWDLNNNDDYDSETIPDTLLHEAWLMFIDSGLKKRYMGQW